MSRTGPGELISGHASTIGSVHKKCYLFKFGSIIKKCQLFEFLVASRKKEVQIISIGIKLLNSKSVQNIQRLGDKIVAMNGD